MGAKSPSDRAPRLRNALGRAWRRLAQAFLLPSDSDSGRRPSRFAHLLKLEDRTLPSATPLGTEFLINQTVAGIQQTTPHPTRSVAVNPKTGDFVTTWSSYNQTATTWDVYARLFNAAGSPLTPEF